LMGVANFAAQYQQAPQTPDGEFFRLKWFEIEDKPARYAQEGEFCISIDSALSTSNTADYTALLVAYIYRQKLHVIRIARGKWDYETLKLQVMDWIRKLYRPGKPVYLVVENAGSGISLGQYLKDHRDERFRFEPHQPRGSKLERASRVLSAVERKVQLMNVPGENGWVQPFLNELMTFPNGKNDDQVDALVQLLWMRWVRCQLGIGNN
jgi:predicted phage terminase large subunit-like protein